MSNQKSQYAEILESVKKLDAPEILNVKSGERKAEVLILPEGKKAHDIKPFLDKYLTAPERRKGTAKVTRLDSFIAHVNRFKDTDSALFANSNMANPSLTAVIDYHQMSYEGKARFGEHRTHYSFPLSKEWLAWIEKDGASFNQAEFACFIEDRIGDVLAQDVRDKESDQRLKELSVLLGGRFAGPGTLVTLSRGLAINEAARVKSATNIATGETNIVYETQHNDEAGAPVKVPNMFLIGIPVFETGDAYRIAVRLRYRVRSGSISWSYNLYRIENVFEDAFEGACNKAKEATGLPLFVGSPE